MKTSLHQCKSWSAVNGSLLDQKRCLQLNTKPVWMKNIRIIVIHSSLFEKLYEISAKKPAQFFSKTEPPL